MRKATFLERILFLPDQWLRRVDLVVAILSTTNALSLWIAASASFAEKAIWIMTALIGFALWATNGTAHGLKRLRSVMPKLLLWMTLRFGM